MQLYSPSWTFILFVVLSPNLLGVNAVAIGPLAAQTRTTLPASQSKATEFELPVRIQWNGVPVEVEAPGYACPTMVDLQGRGVEDLVVGQFSQGNLLHFRNLAAAGETPKLSQPQWLMAAKGRASFPGIRCCTSSTPQFVDWNGDGRLDLLSGCYATPGFPAGHVMLLLGSADHTYSPPIYLTGSQNQRLQNADFSQPGDPQQKILDAVCTHQHAIDLDSDGDLDLIVGSSGGRLFYYKNAGTALAPVLQQPPQRLPIQSPVGRSAPHCVDWNGDGLLDLLTGGSEGGVYLSLNQGTAQQPQWSEFKTLIPATQLPKQISSDPLQPGHSTRLWAYDWNRDGKLDLLVGDCVSLLSPRPGVSEEVFRLRETELRDTALEITRIAADFSAAPASADQATIPRDHPRQLELESKLQQIRSRLNQLESQRHTWAAEKKTGFVWLYLRK